ncbi:DNA-binding transcriptional MerR regulator/DNA gyrase inhibitor GyrI [Paenibacillus sp. DS2015]|uniref:MerR family transcriptional regulator n=1 Tax=Paenibacillus sp. DS2015 TaxID=3373917 RepID=UPI003D1BBB59
MDLQTISMVSKNFGISTRTLRYYEQLGLLQSVKKAGYAYRTYDNDSLSRLKEIIILRKLRIPLKDIQLILQTEETTIALEVFQAKINELSDEITALSTIKSILAEFITHLKENVEVNINPRLLADEPLLMLMDTLSISKNNLKEETHVNDLIHTNESLSKLTNVRIIYLPPATVASIHFHCDEPEAHANEVMNKFVREYNLCEIKQDLRHYGFNNPNPSSDTPAGSPDHGYEVWVTIPEDVVVPEPLTKKYFAGGLYAAHMIKMGDFHEWQWLCDWAQISEEYEPNWGEPECMDGLLEEHLNYINHVNLPNTEPVGMQLDLLIPIKPKHHL